MLNKKNLLALSLMAITPLFVGCGGDDDDGEAGGCSGHEICPPDSGPAADAFEFDGILSRTHSFVDAIDEAHPEIAGSSVTLELDPDAQTATAKDWVAKGLVAGDVVTVWWVFFTDISECSAGVAGAKCGAPDLSGGADGTDEEKAARKAIIIPGFGYAGPAPMGGVVADANGDATFPTLSTPVVDANASNADFLIGNGLRDLASSEIHLVLRTHGQALTGALLDSQLGSFNGGCIEGDPNADPVTLDEPNVGECKNIQFTHFNPNGE